MNSRIHPLKYWWIGIFFQQIKKKKKDRPIFGFFCWEKWFIKSYYVLSHCWKCAAESLWRQAPPPFLSWLSVHVVGCPRCPLGAARVKVEKRGGQAAVNSPLPGGYFGIKLCVAWKKCNPDILAFTVNIWLNVRAAKSTEALSFSPLSCVKKEDKPACWVVAAAVGPRWILQEDS